MTKDKGEKGTLEEAKRAIKETFYGMASHTVVRQMLKERMLMENLFMLITLGDMLGLPLLPPYYSLRLLPYALPNIKSWKRQLLQEKDVTDMLY